MAWTSPMTAVDGTGFSAAQFNTYLRDNLLETAPAKATVAGQWFGYSGLNQVAARTPNSAVVLTSQSTTSTSYTDLATVGPSVTIDTGREALVWIAAAISNSTLEAGSLATFETTGATVSAASDDWAIMVDGQNASTISRLSTCRRMVFQNPGSHTYTMKYRAGSNTATFAQREIIVWPL